MSGSSESDSSTGLIPPVLAVIRTWLLPMHPDWRKRPHPKQIQGMACVLRGEITRISYTLIRIWWRQVAQEAKLKMQPHAGLISILKFQILKLFRKQHPVFRVVFIGPQVFETKHATDSERTRTRRDCR